MTCSVTIMYIVLVFETLSKQMRLGRPFNSIGCCTLLPGYLPQNSIYYFMIALLLPFLFCFQVLDYFSYEHFYVIYCKFWELDTDHDLIIDKTDLLRYNNGGESCFQNEKHFPAAKIIANKVQQMEKFSKLVAW